MGARRQHGAYHGPTPRLFKDGMRELREHAMRLMAEAPSLVSRKVHGAHENTTRASQETAQGVREASRQAVLTIGTLRNPSWPEEDLTADEPLRQGIRRRLLQEIVPPDVFWVILNVTVGLLLGRVGWLSSSTRLVGAPYLPFDMICAVTWYP